MKIIANYVPSAVPPLLMLYIHDAPHRRMHIQIIKQYRVALREAMKKIGIEKAIDHEIDLHVLFVNPSSPDNGNLYLALEQALDGSTLDKPGIVTDDGLIGETRIKKFYNQPAKK
jgi:hypothetical protein